MMKVAATVSDTRTTVKKSAKFEDFEGKMLTQLRILEGGKRGNGDTGGQRNIQTCEGVHLPVIHTRINVLVRRHDSPAIQLSNT